ncbi:MmgE/PrpD family protein [Salinicola sp. RZ23]|uniref:MmgE/PrpD family protein n=1 Tax=Salinicola sp. RZ23 TaxID=1949087 RepID=UPI000DA25236|nr:MmgE/PrpD family protein [Salinicola sp. RZ23]
MSIVQTLATAAHHWNTAALTDEVTLATRKALLDWFATTLPGTTQAPATLLASAFSALPCQGNAVSYVDGTHRSPRYAALVNATASHTVEFDDIFKDGGYHPGSPTIAAALAVAQEIGAEVQALHRAIIGGYELGCRVALAIQPSHYRYWHTTATVGTLGAATATAMLLGGNAETIAHAVALASSFAAGHQQNLQGSGMAKPLHAGHAAEAGVLAGYAASHGITASLASLEAPAGFAAATSDSPGDWQRALAGIGEWTPITRMTIKAHGCCGHIFPAIDGLATLLATTGTQVEAITHIHVEGYAATHQMCDRPEPTTPQEARFSLQYSLATYLLTRRLRLEAFAPETLVRRDIRALMERISVEEDRELSAHYPTQRMARVHLTTTDGQTFSHLQTCRKGDPENPLSLEELIAKYDELSQQVLSKHASKALKRKILDTHEMPATLV